MLSYRIVSHPVACFLTDIILSSQSSCILFVWYDFVTTKWIWLSQMIRWTDNFTLLYIRRINVVVHELIFTIWWIFSYIYECFQRIKIVLLLLLSLLLLKKVGNARLGESYLHQIDSKTPAQQYQPIERMKRKRKL